MGLGIARGKNALSGTINGTIATVCSVPASLINIEGIIDLTIQNTKNIGKDLDTMMPIYYYTPALRLSCTSLNLRLGVHNNITSACGVLPMEFINFTTSL